MNADFRLLNETTSMTLLPLSLSKKKNEKCPD